MPVTSRDTSSTPLRDLMKQIVREPASTRSRSSEAASPIGLARCAVASSTIGGFHMAIRRGAEGDPSSSTSSMSSRPVSRSARSSGLATVALASMIRGSEP